MKTHKQTQGTSDKTIPNFFLEYINKYGNEDKEKVLALGMAYGSFCHLASQTLDDQVEDVQVNLCQKHSFLHQLIHDYMKKDCSLNYKFSKCYRH